MSTVTLWLLVVVSLNYRGDQTPVVLERFTTVADCQHVLNSMPAGTYTQGRCVQAKVAR